jgi:hypothetical protein
VIQRVTPSFEARAPEALRPTRMFAKFPLAGKQQVAVKIHSVVLRIDDIERHTLLFEIKQLVGEIGGHHVHLTLDQIRVAEAISKYDSKTCS